MRPIDGAIREIVASAELLARVLAEHDTVIAAAVRRHNDRVAAALRTVRTDLASLREAQGRQGDQTQHILATHEAALQARIDAISERLGAIEALVAAHGEGVA